MEIISGTEIRSSGGGADGVRVMAFVPKPGARPEHRVVEPLRASEVRAVQSALAATGYDPGALDGLMGPATRGALRAFQGSTGGEVCGCIDYETIVALGLRPLVIQTVIGEETDEPRVEIIAPVRPLAPRAAPAPPPPETVYVATQPVAGAMWVYPAFPVGVPVPNGSPRPATPPPAGVPFGGRGAPRLGPRRTPTRPPPPPP